MESVRSSKRRRSKAAAAADNSLVADFLELRESSMVQTGPKRPRHGGGELWLTPDPLTPLENIQHRRRKRSSLTASKTKPKPSSLTESRRRASTGRRKSMAPKSPEHASTTSDESPTKQLRTAASTLTPLGHLQLSDDQEQNRPSTSLVTKKSSNSLMQTSIVKSPESTSSDKEPHPQAGASSSSLTPSTETQSTSSDSETGISSSYLTSLDNQTRSKITSKKHTASQEKKLANSKLRETSSTSSSTGATSDEAPDQTADCAVSNITPLEQLHRKKKRRSAKRSSVSGREGISARKSTTMKLRSSGVKGVMWLTPHIKQRTPLADGSIHDSGSAAAPQGHAPPPSSAGTDGEEFLQNDLSPLQISDLSSRIEKPPPPPSDDIIEEDKIPSQTEEPAISPETVEHDDPADPEELKGVLKDADSRTSSLRRRTRRNSRVSFGQFVTVAEYSPNYHQHSTGGGNESRSLMMPSFPEENLPPMDKDTVIVPDIQQLSGERDEKDSGSPGLEKVGEKEELDGVAVKSAESSSSSPPPPGQEELEPLGDEWEESMDEMETEEPLEEVEQKRMSRHKKSTVVPRALARKKKGKGKTQANTLPRVLIKNFFMLFSKRRMTKDAMNLISKFTEVYLNQASSDVATYTAHAGRKTIETKDIILLLKRQRFITEDRPFEYLVNKYLPLEHAEELLPCARAGKDVIPQMR